MDKIIPYTFFGDFPPSKRLKEVDDYSFTDGFGTSLKTCTFGRGVVVFRERFGVTYSEGFLAMGGVMYPRHVPA